MTRIRTYYNKHLLNRTFTNPLELQKYIESKVTGVSNLVKVARVYLNYCEKFDKISPNTISKYRQFLKVKHGNPDYHVPADSEVIGNYLKVNNKSNLELVYLVLACSGIRYVECLYFLN